MSYSTIMRAAFWMSIQFWKRGFVVLIVMRTTLTTKERVDGMGSPSSVLVRTSFQLTHGLWERGAVGRPPALFAVVHHLYGELGTFIRGLRLRSLLRNCGFGGRSVARVSLAGGETESERGSRACFRLPVP